MTLGGIGHPYVIYVGRDYASDARLCVIVAIGFLPDAVEGALPWRRYWKWSSTQLPRLLWRGWRPIGVCILGRCRIWS